MCTRFFFSNNKLQPSGSLKEEKYILEKIVSKRTINGKLEYCLKWKDREEIENTWVDANINAYKNEIKEYEDSLKKNVLDHEMYAM